MCERTRARASRRPRCPSAALALVTGALLLFAAGPGAHADNGRRDPLQPPGYDRERAEPQFNASAWTLASTLVSGDRRVARINGRSVRPGDRVGGARVVAIESGRVTLDYRGRKFTIRRSVPEVRRERDS